MAGDAVVTEEGATSSLNVGVYRHLSSRSSQAPRRSTPRRLCEGMAEQLGLSRAALVKRSVYSRNADLLQGFVRALDLNDFILMVHATAGPSALETGLLSCWFFVRLAPMGSRCYPVVGSTLFTDCSLS